MRVKVFQRPNGRIPGQLGAGRGDDRAPTPLRPGLIPHPVPIRDIPTMPAFRGLSIIWHFMRLFAILQWWRLTQRYTHAAAAQLLRRTLQDLGGLWIKLGQLMSLRTDVLPEEICRDLARLQSRAEGFDPALSRRTVEEELGEPLEAVFSRFDTLPFAAASMAQGHYAILRETGTPVMVKVQRPDVEEGFRRDLKFLHQAVAVLKYFGIAPWMQFDDLLWEVGEIMREEADYRYEATNLRRLRRNLRKHGIIAPRPHLQYCTRRMMVMEFVPGTAMSDYIAVQREDPKRAEAWLHENDIDPEEVAQHLISSLLRQVFEDNLFHGDLHPGNIMLLRNSEIAFIDFGTAGTLERQFLDLYGLAVAAIVGRNYRRAADYILALCSAVPSTDLDRVRDEMVQAFRSWEMRSNLHNASYFERALSTANTEVNKVLARHRIQPSWALLKLGRTLGTLDATLSVLAPDRDVRSLYATYFQDYARRSRRPGAIADRAGVVLREAMQTVQEMRTLMLPYLRGRTLAVRGALDRVTMATTLFLRYLRIGFIVLAGMLIYYLLDINSVFDNERNEVLEELFGWLPNLHLAQWVTLIVLLLVVARLLRRTAIVLRSG